MTIPFPGAPPTVGEASGDQTGAAGRCLYLDCFSGAAGDMLLGALVDVGLDVDELVQALDTLPVGGYRLWPERVTRRGIVGTRLHVDVQVADQPHRRLADILALLEDSGLPVSVVGRASAVFRRLARAEAAVHGTAVEEVHFHEVGAVDSIVDVTGCVWGLHALGVTEVYASALPLGEGWVETAHGRLPVPAPATLQILAGAGVPIQPHVPGVRVELVTPTAAALLAELAAFGRPALFIEAVGYGFGARDLPWPNAVRAWLGHRPVAFGGEPPLEHDIAALLECNLDNTTGEALGHAMQRLFEAGALDVWFTPIQMKKNRPAVMLAALAPAGRAGDIARLMLEETGTLGVRQTMVSRYKAGREHLSVETPWGCIRVKVKVVAGQRLSAVPEYEDCAALARQAGVSLLRVQAAAQAAALAALQDSPEPPGLLPGGDDRWHGPGSPAVEESAEP